MIPDMPPGLVLAPPYRLIEVKEGYLLHMGASIGLKCFYTYHFYKDGKTHDALPMKEAVAALQDKARFNGIEIASLATLQAAVLE